MEIAINVHTTVRKDSLGGKAGGVIIHLSTILLSYLTISQPETALTDSLLVKISVSLSENIWWVLTFSRA